MKVAFTVPGNPVPWQRAQSRNGQRFTAPRTRAYQDAVRAAMPAVAPIDGPVLVTLRFFRKDAQPCDLDNLSKTIFDAIQGKGGVILDDRQVTWLLATKAIDRENPRAEVEIEPASAEGQEATATEKEAARVSCAALNALDAWKRRPAKDRAIAAQRRLRSSVRKFNP